MTSTSTPNQVPTTAPAYRGRLFAVVLVAAWMGAFAVTSAPATHAQAMPKADPTCTLVTGTPLPSPGGFVPGEWIC
jgi:hypothetical protein